MKKNMYTWQVENLKRRLGQKWVSRWTKNPKGRSRQKLGIKRNTMSHWITSHPEFGINYQVQKASINQLHLQLSSQVMRHLPPQLGFRVSKEKCSRSLILKDWFIKRTFRESCVYFHALSNRWPQVSLKFFIKTVKVLLPLVHVCSALP